MTQTQTDEMIDILWTMKDARAVKNKTGGVSHYICSCSDCSQKSVGGEGGMVFFTAEELLAHRGMSAHKCPGACGIHITESRGSIIRHIKGWHSKNYAELVSQGMDEYKSFLYPDYTNFCYTLKKPEMDAEELSPIQQAGRLVGMISPRAITPQPRETKASLPKISQWVVSAKSATPTIPEALNESARSPPAAVPAPVKVVHYAQKDMYLEKECEFGKTCRNKDKPFSCPLNHHGLGKVIKAGKVIPDDFCPWTRPPFSHCGDGRCTKAHLRGRKEFIEEKKAAYYDSQKPTMGNVVAALSGDTLVAVVPAEALSPEALEKLAEEAAMAAAIAESEWNNAPRKIFQEDKVLQDSSNATTDDEEEVDLSDDEAFANAFAHAHL
jgi:hypothetical protein